MDIFKTLKYKITNQTEIFHATLEIYNNALRFMINVIDHEFKDVDEISTKIYRPRC